MTMTILDPADLATRLRTAARGRVVTAGDADYDAVRQVGDANVDFHPVAIVRVVDADDVAAVIRVARETGTPLAVRGGGHSEGGLGSLDDGIVVDLRELRGLEIDPVARTAHAEAGLTAAEVTAAAAEHGLAVGFGDTGSVGIGGITLGGGIGFLVRKHGMTIDALLGAELVTAAGERIEVDAEHHPDLFWAIRGGGGNFGVVTAFRYRLEPLAGVVGGILVLPATPKAVAGFIAACDAAPDELSAIANVMTCPPMPFVPEEVHGQLVNLAFVCYAGDAESGERAIAPLRAVAEPIADLVRPISYPEMFFPDDPDYRPLAATRGLFLDHVDLATAATIVEHLEASDAPLRAVQLRVLGGAMARVPADATAFGHRSARVMAMVVAFHEGGDDGARRQAWVDRLAAAIDQGVPGAYVNFISDDGLGRVRDAYPPATFARLAEVKRDWDPENLFRRNQNVPPAA